MSKGAHGKVYMYALFNNLNIRYRHNFYERQTMKKKVSK